MRRNRHGYYLPSWVYWASMVVLYIVGTFVTAGLMTYGQVLLGGLTFLFMGVSCSYCALQACNFKRD